MLETTSYKKNKINLPDYDYKKDIQNRLLISSFSFFDVQVVEEILYSSLKIPLKSLAKNLDCEENDLSEILKKLEQTQFLSVKNDTIFVDKKMRKYFDFHILQFDQYFSPNLEFFQSLLQLTPIHVLPFWYSIPRTSNNIFESIIEKYLLTPQIYRRYINELSHLDPIIQQVLQYINKPPFEIESSKLRAELGLSEEKFEEQLIYLEYSLICSKKYKRNGDKYVEIITPFQEWSDYLSFLFSSKITTIKNSDDIEKFRRNDFSFIEDMTKLFIFIKNEKIKISWNKHLINLENSAFLAKKTGIFIPDEACDEKLVQHYITKLIKKLLLLQLIVEKDGELHSHAKSNYWFELSIEEKALSLYKDPSQHIMLPTTISNVFSEKQLREAEKSIKRVMHNNWVLFDDFIKGVTVPIKDEQIVSLKKEGKNWKYNIPQYLEEEKILINVVIFDWFFTCGITEIGSYDGKDCFRITNFGRKIFGD